MVGIKIISLKSYRYILLLSGLLLLVGCGNNQDNSRDNVSQLDSTEIRYKSLPAITSISEDKLNTITQWEKFEQLSILMERFQRQNQGDLSYFAEEFIRLNGELSKDSLMPERFNKAAVHSRIVVLNTFSKQLKIRIEEGAVLDSINISRERVLKSYNALRLQLAEHIKSKLFEEFLKEQDKTNN